MTTQEFSREFDIYYNSIATNAAPDIDLYEKSVYLTKAQLELVKNYFNPQGNKYQRGFENSSKRRTDLSELIRNGNSIIEVQSDAGLSEDSQFFRINNDVFLIIQERAKVTSEESCINNKIINVIPKTHDEFNIQKDNPFKQPNEKRIWRIDYFSQQGANKNVELISPYTIAEYKYRYIVFPSPIVLTNLTTLYPGESLSIDGVTQEQTCKLDKNIHREIIDRAVELAVLDYRNGDLQSRVQLDLRNE